MEKEGVNQAVEDALILDIDIALAEERKKWKAVTAGYETALAEKEAEITKREAEITEKNAEIENLKARLRELEKGTGTI